MGRTVGISLPSGFVTDLARAASGQDVLTVTAKWLPEVIDADRTSVSLQTDADHLQLCAFGGSLVLEYSGYFAIQDSLIGRAFAAGDVLNIPDLTASYGTDVEVLVKAGLRSALVAPMISAGTALGTINLANRKAGFFSSEDETALSSIADLIAGFLAVNQHAEEQRRRASIDTLTGLMSRGTILDQLDTAFEADEERPALLYVDVNAFKAVNDSHGHLVGDQFLQAIGQRITGLMRDTDMLGRLGGDEFLIVVKHDRSGETAVRLAQRITESLHEPIAVGSLLINAAVSIGVATIESESSTAADLLYDADQTMYSAKTRGAPSAVVSQTIRRQSAIRSAADRDIDNALENGEIGFHYQPVRSISTLEILGAEALVRWDHPEHGWIPAPVLIERIEATGRTDAFTRWGVETLVREWAEVRAHLPWFWNKAVSMNFTPRQLAWPGLADFLVSSLAEADFRTHDIIVEVVESAAITPGDASEQSLARLGAADLLIALDDFGTGHNALRYFTRFPIHAIKFDRSLVRAMVDHDVARRILRSLSALAADLEVFAVAEGVETRSEADLCMDAGIDVGQGWYFGRPGPLENFIEVALAEGAPSTM